MRSNTSISLQNTDRPSSPTCIADQHLERRVLEPARSPTRLRFRLRRFLAMRSFPAHPSLQPISRRVCCNARGPGLYPDLEGRWTCQLELTGARCLLKGTGQVRRPMPGEGLRSVRSSIFADSTFWRTVRPSGHFKVIFCRNVMIYFDQQTQETLVNKLASRLVSGWIPVDRSLRRA